MTALNIFTLVLSIVASIVGIVANWRLHRVEKKLVDITTHGANSPVYIIDTDGGKVNLTSISGSSVTITINQANSITLQRPITAPSTNTSPPI